ncbi:MAG: YciI family protein [Rhodoglobus sp.]
MTKFLYLYHSPMTPAEATPPDDSQMQEVMNQWMAWGAETGEHLTDFGSPLANGVRVSPGGATTPSTREVSGYSMIEADSMDEALSFAKNHPHLNMPDGCEIEVHELQPVPGM